MQTNFTQLYSQLDLSPDCSLEELKRAYRRRIAELHPDRQSANARSPDAPRELRELISMYNAATRFHRRHGRLPGRSTPHPSHGLGGAAPPKRAAPDEGSPSPRSWGLFALVVLVLLLLVIEARDEGSGNADDGAAAGAKETDLPPALSSETSVLGQSFDEAPSDLLEIGMRPAEVRAIQGDPMHADELQWEYGPSWLRFEHNRLVDWYSSPLHPLKTASVSPPPEDGPGAH